MGPCSRKKIFELFSREIKIAYEDECNVKWPLLKRNIPEGSPKISALRRGNHIFGPVEPITGEIISGTFKQKKKKGSNQMKSG
ncbi:CPW-WPC family protein, putative [Plasmodium ovale curtisi]|nr:CPW-WPC family protein, putative [Plasmodium ovale curtisi]